MTMDGIREAVGRDRRSAEEFAGKAEAGVERDLPTLTDEECRRLSEELDETFAGFDWDTMSFHGGERFQA